MSNAPTSIGAGGEVPVWTLGDRLAKARKHARRSVAEAATHFDVDPKTINNYESRTLSHYLRTWMRAAGIKARALDGRSAHGLRRTGASDVLDASGDLRAVQEMLGHRSIETTARHYLRPVSMAQLRDAMEGRDYEHDDDDAPSGSPRSPGLTEAA